MLASLTVLCIHMCQGECPQCSILEKLNPLMKSDLARERKTELRILNLWGLTINLLTNWPIMPAYPPMLVGTYYV